ncbi:nephrin-like [Penaeus monodon]|uniref:nephrin-like n=1 Tax=Penaeus monodon TaxID=6687 RepID=UPI0018A765FF|nr:nephrin-like [Penaeus monodon]
MQCDISTSDSTDRVILVLWYKDGIGTPIYSYYSRGKDMSKPRDWSDKKTLGDRGHFDLKSSPAALVLDNVRASDEGIYRCRVDFKKSPTRNARTNLTVIIPPNSPTILAENGLQVWTMVGPYNEGASMTLICDVSGGKPPPRVTWWLEGEIIDDTFESPQPNIVTNTLTIPHLARKHLHASLECRASNTNLSVPVQTIITIEMNFKPLTAKILGSREPLSSGREYELVCHSVGARPSASITWWLDGDQLTNATTSTASSGNVTLSTLTFIPTDADGGKFLKCKAESPVIHHTHLEDQWRLEVYYTPQVNLAMGSSLIPNTIKEGDDVYFECNIHANPWVYKVVWYHNGIQVQHNVSAGVIVSNQSLVIQRVQRQQAGLYTCVASNIEGDGQSNAVILKVQYAPVCAPGQTHVYGAARHEEVSVTCRLDAVPPAVQFFWKFNSSGEVVDIAESHVDSQDLQSSLSYVARTELDYGTLLCWGSNSLGRQKKPCIYKVIPAGHPDPPENCSLFNQTTEALRIRCFPGYDGGLQQRFIIEAFETETDRLLLNITEKSTPDFTLTGLEPGASYLLYIYAANEKGISDKRRMQGYTLRDVAERRTAQVRPPPEELMSFTPIIAVVVGVLGSLVLVAITSVVVVSLKRKRRRPRNKTVALPIQTSLADSRDLDDKNPDLIPANGNSETENKSPTTPEEGGFGSVHICASVPYPSNVYGTYPRTPRTVAATTSQNGELMYAELSFPRGGQYPPGTLPRRKPEPTIYAQIDHGLSSNVPPVSMGVVPVTSGMMGGTSMCPSTSLSGAPICSSGMMGGMMGGGGPPIMMGNPGMVPGGIPIGDVSIAAYTTPAPPPHGFGGHPLAPAVVPEEDEQATAETPLMTNPKESEV